MAAVINPYVWGTGRRKTAVARVRIKEGTGKFLINKLEVRRVLHRGDAEERRSRPAPRHRDG